MKKIILILLAVTSLFSLLLTGCAESKSGTVEEAAVKLEKYWEDVYDDSDIGDGYFEIKNTGVIKIKENGIDTFISDSGKAIFKDVKFIIEFDLYTDYLGTAPYYSDPQVYNNVVVYNVRLIL